MLQIIKLRLIKVKKVAQAPMAGKQQGWDVNPGLMGTNGHASPLQEAAPVTQLAELYHWACAVVPSPSPAWSWLPFGHPVMLLPINCQIFITSISFAHTLDIFTMTTHHHEHWQEKSSLSK